MKPISFKIIGITDVTVRNILQNCSCEALGLYMAYFEVAKWQETYRIKATTGFMSKRTGWGKDKVIKYKKQLIELGVLKDHKTIGDDGQVKGHYVEILHLVDEKPHSENPEAGFTRGWKSPTQVLSTGNISANNKKKVLSEETSQGFSFDLEVEKNDNNPNRALQVIGMFMRLRKLTLSVNITNKETYKVFLKRNMKIANQLKHFSDEQLVKASKKVKRDFKDIDWGLETILKTLTK